MTLNGDDGEVLVNALIFRVKQRQRTSCPGSIGEGASFAGSGGRAGLGVGLSLMGAFDGVGISEAWGKGE